MKNDKYSKLLKSIPPSGIRKFFDLVIGSKDIISLGVGEPDFITPWHIREEAFYALEKGKTSYTSNKGLLELRSAISYYLKEQFESNYDPGNEILITVGVSEGVDLAFRSIINPGDEIIIPEPCYVCYSPLATLSHAKVVTLDTTKNNFDVTAEIIAKKITKKTKVILLSYPNNPTGATIKKEEQLKILELAKKNDLWVISDEIYAELSYDDMHTSFASLPGAKERTILLNGFSKGWAMTGWRIGYICGPKELIDLSTKIHQYSVICAPITSQYAAITAIKNSRPEIEKMRKSYLHRRNFLVDKLNSIGLTTKEPAGAFYVLPSIKNTGLTSEDFCIKLLNEEKVAVVPGNIFGACGEGFVRLAYPTSLDNLKEAAIRIKRFIDKL